MTRVHKAVGAAISEAISGVWRRNDVEAASLPRFHVGLVKDDNEYLRAGSALTRDHKMNNCCSEQKICARYGEAQTHHRSYMIPNMPRIIFW